MIRTKDGKSEYNLYYTGTERNKHHGVGIAVRKDIDGKFERITDRICKFETKIKTLDSSKNKDIIKKLSFISCYAPTLCNTLKDPKETEDFYNTLENAISKINPGTILIIGGDFNAKTGSGHKDFKEQVGKYGKGLLNENGEYLLNMATRQNLTLTNTFFKHKMCHRTTWTCPEKVNTERKNPYRNQIDYIITRINTRKMICNSRSYTNLNINTDHKLVKTTIEWKWWKLYNKSKKVPKPQLHKLRNPETKLKYIQEVEKLFNGQTEEGNHNIATTNDNNIQNKWNNIVNAVTIAAKNILSENKKKNKFEDKEIKQLSEKQKLLRRDIESSTNKERRNELRKQRKKLQKELQKLIKEKEDKIVERMIENIEKTKQDSRDMYEAVRILQRRKTKANLIIKDKKGKIPSSTTGKIKIITEHFKNELNSENAKIIPIINPTKMKQIFTSKEIRKAINKMKNGKSAGCDKVYAEMLKNSPELITEKIAEILNECAETGKHPEEIITGLLIPLQKPGKEKGPPANLRPIVLLSILRKIVAICLIERIYTRLRSSIPSSQAAYSKGRSTTELVFTMKTIVEKAISSKDLEANILMLDMSKAFDTIQRGTLIEDLSKILDSDELHLVTLLLREVKLIVQLNNTQGEPFTTNMGSPQGDCASALFFIYYLAETIKDDNQYNEIIPPIQLLDHDYATPTLMGMIIDQQYADDISWITLGNVKNQLSKISNDTQKKLEERNLKVNESKREEYSVSRIIEKERKEAEKNRIPPTKEYWKNCKFLGSMIDTETDIKRRYKQANIAYNNLKNILISKKVSLTTKIKLYQSLIASIFLYNCELWTMTKQRESKVDIYQRKFLRNIINIKYPKIIKNENLYKITKQTPWSITIKYRRLKWFDHLCRLPEDCPAKLAFHEILEKPKLPRGRPPITWIENLKKDLRELNYNIYEAIELSKQRKLNIPKPKTVISP